MLLRVLILELNEQWQKEDTPDASLHFQREQEEPRGSHLVTNTKLSDTGGPVAISTG